MLRPTRRLPLLLLLLAASTGIVSALPTTTETSTHSLRKRDADIESLWALGIPKNHKYKDHSGKGGDPKDKYFHESTFHPHYDGRFVGQTLPDGARQPQLTLLVQTYLSFMAAIGAETWIMHGTLLGWWWNRRIMPWDSDVDVMVSERGMRALAAYHNMTVHTFRLPKVVVEDGEGRMVGAGVDAGGGALAEISTLAAGEQEDAEAQKAAADKDGSGNSWLPNFGGSKSAAKDAEEDSTTEPRQYLLEVNPHYANHSTTDWLNVIDARWIDVATGLFIDITTLHHEDPTRPDLQGRPSKHQAGGGGGGNAEPETDWLYSKDKHRYRAADIFPLRDSVFERMPVKIPYAYSQLLEEEYGPRALTATKFAAHEFDEVALVWRKQKQKVGDGGKGKGVFKQF